MVFKKWREWSALAKDVNQGRNVRAGSLLRVRENFCRERQAVYFKITFLSRSFSFCKDHTDLDESENEKRRKSQELHELHHCHSPFSHSSSKKGQ